ncbi:hypothetical protein NEOCIP111885_01438 [Pseudoneobacillus rhizosphaerae]|uniref:Lipoprotein n=2 Tax=Pseudoneobacillus rhizosphaerae TaxID=2880968 RepID=A0A9C7G809_9BACI|nr:hypothetical protein NEOCIP111885_01438 [Pseudoneobacillus rhizosphaerae]
MNMRNRLLFILLILLLAACGAKTKEPIIGVQTLKNDEGSRSVVRMHYFDSKEEALDFYYKKGIIDFVMMVHPDKEEKSLFKEIDAKDENGTKSVEFIQENGNHAEDLAFIFLYEELGLGIECAFNGKECK